MATIVSVDLKVTTFDGQVERVDINETTRFSVGAGTRGKIEDVSLTGSAFTAFTVPSGAKLLVVKPASTAASLVAKGVTGDTGVACVPSSNWIGQALVIPLGTSPSVGILNSGSTVAATLYWY